MKAVYRNIFLGIGLAAIVLMLCTSDISYPDLWMNIQKAGYWFPAVLGLWILIYWLNAWSWSVIINDGTVSKVPFRCIYKYTISGYALNYVTPVGLLGGEPYRIMELTPYVGASKATSSVILYAMMHIFFAFLFLEFFHIALFAHVWADHVERHAVFYCSVCDVLCLGYFLFLEGI